MKSSSRSSRRAVRAVGVLVLGSCIALAAQGVAQASPNAGKPPLPTLGQYDRAVSQPLSSADGQRNDAKQLKATQYLNAFRQISTDSATGPNIVQYAVPDRTLGEPLYQQINESYCGPATVAMVTTYLGVGFGGSSSQQQNSAASLLATTQANGTAWYGSDNVPSYPGGSWYPVADVVNYQLYTHGRGAWYSAVPLPGSPTSTQQGQFVSDLVYDLNNNYPEADNQYSVSGYQIGYQPNGIWMHWWSAMGFMNQGNTTLFNDPASWSSGRTSSAPTTGGAHSVVVALGGRGYIW